MNQDQEFIQWALRYIKKNGIKAFEALLKNKVGLDLRIPVSCEWQAIQLFEQGFEHLTRPEKIEAWRRGFMPARRLSHQWNKIMDVFRSSLVANHIGGPSADQHLQFDYVALGGRKRVTTDSPVGEEISTLATDLGHELFRAAPDEVYEAGVGTAVVMLYLDADTANPTNDAIQNGNPFNNLQFNILHTNINNYQIGDVIRVDTGFGGSWETMVIDNVDYVNDFITVSADTPPSSLFGSGQVVERGYGEVGIFMGAASGTPGSGTPVNIAPLTCFKNNETSLLIEAQLHYVI